MNEDPKDSHLWLVLVGFLVFCVAVGLLSGFIAYGVVQAMFDAADS